MSRNRIWLVSSIVLVAAMLLGACGGPTATPGQVTVIVGGTPQTVVVTPTPEPAQPANFNSKDPKTLVVATFGEPETLDPALDYETAGGGVNQNVYETLVYYNKTKPGEFIPQLATEVPSLENGGISADGTTYTFKIRTGVKFHNGADMTPEDVAYSFQRGLLQGGPDSPQWLLTEPFFGIGTYDVAELIDPSGTLDGDPETLKTQPAVSLTAACQAVVDAITFDDAAGTVTMKLKQPWGPFLATLAQTWGSVMDKQWTVENGGWDGSCDTWQNYYGVKSENDKFTALTNGTGPFMLDHWTPGEELVMAANPNYWRTEPAWEGGPTGAPALDRVVYKYVNEWGTRFAMMQAGDADFVAVPRENVTQIDPMVGEQCEYAFDTDTFNCAPTDNPSGPLRLFKGQPTTSRTDAFFTWNIAPTSNFIGSGQLDGNGITPDFFSDIHVRKAFNYCFDFDAYINDALYGEGVQNVGILIPGMVGYDPNGPKYTFDTAKCEEELKAAWGGQVWDKGFRLQIAYNTGNTTRQTIAQILQATLGGLNEGKFNIEITGLPWANFLRQVRDRTLPIFVSGWQEDIHDPHNWAQPFTVGTYGRQQMMPEELYTQLQDLVSRGVAESDPAKRTEIYTQMDQLDYDQAIAIRLAVASGRHYEQRWVQGWFYNPIFSDNYYYTVSKQ